MSNRFEELIAQGEGISVEFKECKDSLTKSIFETICSFLNRFGGDIFLGVADDGTILGIDKEKSKKNQSRPCIRYEQSAKDKSYGIFAC